MLTLMQINISETWGIVAAIFIVIMPLACEIYEVLKSKRQQRRVADEVEAIGYSRFIIFYII